MHQSYRLAHKNVYRRLTLALNSLSTLGCCNGILATTICAVQQCLQPQQITQCLAQEHNMHLLEPLSTRCAVS